MQEKSSSKIVVVAGLGAVALVGAWLGMRVLSADPTEGEIEVAKGPAALQAPGKAYDPKRVENLRRVAEEKMKQRKRLEVPENLKPRAALVPPGPETSWDAWLVAALGKAAGDAAKQEDVLGKERPRVDLHGEGRVWRRADVDLDRDGQWDERWELLGGQLRRRVSPEDNGSYPRELSFVSGVWTLPPGTGLKEAPKAP